jgi:hypothetical protein
MGDPTLNVSSSAQPSTIQTPPEDPWESGIAEFDPGAGHGYMSSGELLAWLAVVGGNTYDDMRRQMIGSDRRTDLQEDLGHVKSVIEEVQSSKDLVKLETEIRALVDKYAGTEFEGRVNALFTERLAQFDALHLMEAVMNGTEDATTESVDGTTGWKGSGMNGNLLSRAQEAFLEYTRIQNEIMVQLDSWKTDIEAKTDKLGTEDQLALIRIQELNSRITQATQLASNLLAAQDQAQSAAIMNLKG